MLGGSSVHLDACFLSQRLCKKKQKSGCLVARRRRSVLRGCSCSRLETAGAHTPEITFAPLHCGLPALPGERKTESNTRSYRKWVCDPVSVTWRGQPSRHVCPPSNYTKREKASTSIKNKKRRRRKERETSEC